MTTPRPHAELAARQSVADEPRCTAAGGHAEIINVPGYPLMVRAVDYNTLRAQLAEARRDAERWRWLKDHARIFRQSPDMSGNHYWMVHATTTLRGPTLDAAIDNAKGKTP